MDNLTVTFTQPGEVALVAGPAPAPGPGQVLVRTERSLISTGTELTLLEGDVPEGSVWDRLRSFPKVPGYSNVGEVVAVGAGVDGAWMGARVHSHGPHQRFALAPAAKLARVPEGLASEQATFATLAKVAMIGLRRGGLAWGERVAVLGLGIIGQLCVRLALFAGARPVYAIEPHAERRALLPRHPGLIALGEGPPASWREAARADHGGLDLAIDLTGHPDAPPLAAGLLRTGGRLVISGSPRGPSLYDFHDLCNRESITILGAHSAHHPLEEHPFLPFSSARHGALFLSLLASGELDVEGLITHRFPAAQAGAAYALLGRSRQQAMGAILEW